MLKKNWKLLEAFGLLLILLAWGLEWRSVKKWDEVNNVYWKFWSTFNQAIYTADNQALMILQFAINRSVKQSELNPDDPNSAKKQAWKYAEVRRLWFKESVLELKGVEELLKNISQISSKYGLNIPPTLSSVEHNQMELLKKLKKLIDTDDQKSKVLLIPKATAGSIIQAVKISEEIGELVSASIKPLNELGEEIKIKRRSNTKMHGYLFILGSILLILAKILEWLIEKKNSNEVLAVDT